MSELGPFQARGPIDWLLQGGTGCRRIITTEPIWKVAKGHSGALAVRAGDGRLGGRGAARRSERRRRPWRRPLLAVILVGVHLQSFAAQAFAEFDEFAEFV